MNPLVLCIPNFSEGRRAEVVERIVSAMGADPETRILHKEMDPDHNRSVVTLAGSPDGVIEAAYAGIEQASKLIDLKHHQGEHPRIGAADVVPLVPFRGIDLAGCAELARRLGRRVGDELGIPVFLYEAAASNPNRRSLADVRNEGFEALSEQVGHDPNRKPDFGPSKLHPSAGAVAIGARGPLIAFNVNLVSDDVKKAKAIARAVRESNGGLPAVRAKGFLLATRRMAQVSMNLIDYRITSLTKAIQAVEHECRKRDVAIAGAELVGLIPREALGRELLPAGIRIDEHRILENRLREAGLS
jgi:glutamate formiminotransferase